MIAALWQFYNALHNTLNFEIKSKIETTNIDFYQNIYKSFCGQIEKEILAHNF